MFWEFSPKAINIRNKAPSANMFAFLLILESRSVVLMIDSVKETLLAAVRQLLRPVVRILLRNGVSFAEYSEISRTVFVEVATRDFRLQGTTRPSQSRVAIVTGLTRKEVSRLSQAIDANGPLSNSNLNRVGRLLAGWHQDPDFTGPYGLPLELELESRAGSSSFRELVRRYSGDMPPKAMLDELNRVGAVTVQASGRIKVLTRSYIPSETDPAGMQFMGVALRDLAETLDYNLNANIEGGYFERRVWSPAGILPSDMTAFDELVTQKGQEFLEMLDNWLTGKESEADQVQPEEKIKVGVGVYLFSDANRTFRED